MDQFDKMIERGSATESEMIVAFLRAEVDSSRYGNDVKRGLAATGSGRWLIDAPDLSDSHQNAIRKRLLGYRGYERREALFSRFPLDVTWCKVDLDANDFETMQYIANANWNEISKGTRRLVVGARNFPQFQFDQRFQHIRAMIQAVRDGMRFPPLILAQHPGRHLVLVEGHSRATAYVAEGSNQLVEAFVGSSPSMDKWPFY